MQPPTATRVLFRHFLRRFLDNDLISPHIDLHENVALVCASFASTTLFLSVILASKTLFGLPIPGPTAIIGLGDNYFFLGVSMSVMALAAALQWDALSLDARDTFNLGPLPLARGTIVRAKLAALVAFASGFAAAVVLMPTVVYQSLLVAKIPVGLSGLVRLAIAHAVAGMCACAFGFLAVLAVRETLRAVLGAALFARVSMLAQAVIILCLLSVLLLLPGASSTVPRVWAANGFPAPYAQPPLWFLSLAETLGGGVIPNVSGMKIPFPLRDRNARAIAMYHANEPMFRELAGLALVALGTVALVGLIAFAWNTRRLPQPIPAARRHRQGIAVLAAIAGGRDAVARAGFTFALQALVRSAPHRIAMAAAVALSVAFGFVMFGRIRHVIDPANPPLSLLSIQTLVLTVMAGGFRHAVRLPAEIKANWVLQLAWGPQRPEQRFLAGAERAAAVGIVIPVLIALLPLHLLTLDARVAAGHLAIGFVYALTVIELMFTQYRGVPFASIYVPAGNVKTVGPLVVFLFFLFLSAFGRLERVALQSPRGVAILLAALAIAFAALRVRAYTRVVRREPATFEDAPEPATQWLGLSG